MVDKYRMPKDAKKVSIPNGKLKSVRFLQDKVYLLIDNKIHVHSNKSFSVYYTAAKNEIINDFWLTENSIYMVKRVLDKNVLSLEPANGATHILAKNLDLRGEGYKILNLLSGKIILFDTFDKTVFILNDALDRVELSKKDFLGYDFLPAKNLFLIYTPMEISKISLVESPNEENLTRFSSINKASAQLRQPYIHYKMVITF